MGPLSFAKADDLSTIVLDRKGELLRAFITKSERWRLPVDPGQSRPNLFEAIAEL